MYLVSAAGRRGRWMKLVTGIWGDEEETGEMGVMNRRAESAEGGRTGF